MALLDIRSHVDDNLEWAEGGLRIGLALVRGPRLGAKTHGLAIEPKLDAGDGALDFWRALDKAYSIVKELQRGVRKRSPSSPTSVSDGSLPRLN